MAKRFTYYGQGYDTDAQAFITAAGITGNLQKNTLNTFVNMLKGIGTTNSSNLFPKIYALYPYCPIDETTANATAYSFNLISPATFQVTWTGFIAGDYTVNGVIGGAGKYGNTNLNQLTDIGTLTHGIDAYIRTQNALNQCSIGAIKTSGSFDGGQIFPYNSATDASFVNIVNSTAVQATRTSLMSTDYDGTNQNKYRNGTLFSQIPKVIGVPNNLTYYLHARNFGGALNAPSTKSYAGFSIRQPFSINEMVDFNEAWQYYQTNIIIGGRYV